MRFSSVSALALVAALPGALALTSAAALAQNSTPATVELDAVVLSGGLAPIAAAEYGRAYTLIGGEEIATRGLTSVQDALRAVPGVSLAGVGRSLTQVRMRGLEGDHTLFLIDGVDAAAGGGEYQLSGLDTANIERIEVLRGPQSVFFGSRASGGVINIIPKKAEGPAHGLRFETGNGHLAHLYAQNRSAGGGLRFSYTDHRDRGVDDAGQNGERDAIHRKSARIDGDVSLGSQLGLRLALARAEEKYAYDANGFRADLGYDGAIDDRDSFRWSEETLASIGATYLSAGGRLSHDLSLAQSFSKSRFDEADGWSTARTQALKYRAQIGLDGEVATASHLLNLLVERQEDRSMSPASQWQATDIHYRRDVTSYAAEYRGSFSEAWSLQAGLRFDDNSAFKDFTSWNLATSYVISPQIRLHASAGRASVAPGFTELYAVYKDWQSNPYLRPERSLGGDIGVEFTTADGRGLLDVTLFQHTTEDRIITTRQGGVTRPVNDLGRARSAGLELSARYALNPQTDLGLSYTLLDAENADGTRALRRPSQELGLTAAWRSADERLTLSGDLRLVKGSRDTKYDSRISWDPLPAETLPGFGVVNLAASWKLNDQVSLTGRVLNVFDRKYAETWGYRAQDRALWAGLSAKF